MTSPPPAPMSLRCEYRADPLGIDTSAPRLSWISSSLDRDAVQSAYQIIASDRASGDLLWDSGKTNSTQSIHVPYAGAGLRSAQAVQWKVRVWDGGDRESDWSVPANWRMGLLSLSDWTAQWISLPPARPFLDLQPASYLRRSFEIAKPIARATMFATARGVYTLHLNGSRVDDHHFAPGWTDYTQRIQYQTHDVTPLLQNGANAVGAILGDGWYASFIGFENKRDNYGTIPQFLAQILIQYTDGSSETIVTDDAWRGSAGPIVFSDLLMGEMYDARFEKSGWDTAVFDDARWNSVTLEKTIDPGPGPALVAQIDPPVRQTDELASREITSPTPGTYIFDMGQNLVGWARLSVQGPAGSIVQLRFGEMLNADGTLYVDNLRSAKATDTYILKGGERETFEPHFTFHGFRYVEVTGYPGTPEPSAIAACVLHSDTPRTATFECSEPLVNQLVRNIDWGQRGNFLSIPTDCPQRDERLGWLGDAQVFVRTAAGSRDVAAFFEKWMYDVVDAQSAEGAFSDVAPRLVDLSDGAPAWADAGVIVPWTIYQVYGDTRILETHYDAMARWIDYLDRENPDHLWMNRRNSDFGDWLSINAETDKDLLATAYFAYDAALMARIARILGHPGDAERYDILFTQIKASFLAAFVSGDARLKGETQTGYVLALRFGLLPEGMRAAAAKHLVEDIAAKNWHLSTGFVGVGYLCPVLSDAGYTDVAYRLLLNETFPSWGYSIRQGATTIWERWNGWTREDGFGDVGMNSFNHYSLGSVGEWLQRYVAGIDTDPESPGYSHILIHPRPSRRMRFVRASFESVLGSIAVEWTLDDGTFALSVTVPANTTATVTLPDNRIHKIGSGTYQFASPWKE